MHRRSRRRPCTLEPAPPGVRHLIVPNGRGGQRSARGNDLLRLAAWRMLWYCFRYVALVVSSLCREGTAVGRGTRRPRAQRSAVPQRDWLVGRPRQRTRQARCAGASRVACSSWVHGKASLEPQGLRRAQPLAAVAPSQAAFKLILRVPWMLQEEIRIETQIRPGGP